jgi:hypothetical protein
MKPLLFTIWVTLFIGFFISSSCFGADRLLIRKKGWGEVVQIFEDGSPDQTLCDRDCNNVLIQRLERKSVVTLYAKSIDGIDFIRWSGDCRKAAGNPFCHLKIKKNTQVKAVFGSVAPILRVNLTRGGTVAGPDVQSIYNPNATDDDAIKGINCSVSTSNSGASSDNLCIQSLPYGLPYSLIAIPDNGYCFYQWEGDCQSFGDNPSCDLDMTIDRSVKAIFLKKLNTNITLNGCL